MILVCMGYYAGDADIAMEVTGQMGKLLAAKSEIVSLCYVHRHDCPPPLVEVMTRDRQYFSKVYSQRATYKYEGWPSGCNAIAYTVLNHVLPGADKSVQCGLLMESDCVITRQGWDVELWEEWQKTRAEKKMICGTVLPWAFHKGSSHVNASAMWGRNVAKRMGGISRGKPKNIAWDYYWGAATTLLARNSPLFRLDWKRPSITAKELFASPSLVYHGVKGRSAIEAVNKKFKLS